MRTVVHVALIGLGYWAVAAALGLPSPQLTVGVAWTLAALAACTHLLLRQVAPAVQAALGWRGATYVGLLLGLYVGWKAADLAGREREITFGEVRFGDLVLATVGSLVALLLVVALVAALVGWRRSQQGEDTP